MALWGKEIAIMKQGAQIFVAFFTKFAIYQTTRRYSSYVDYTFCSSCFLERHARNFDVEERNLGFGGFKK